MLEQYDRQEMSMERKEKKELDPSDPFHIFQVRVEEFKKEPDELLMGAVVQIDGDEMEQAAEDFVKALNKEADEIEGKSRIKSIKARGLKALAQQTKVNLARLGYKI
jgi:hypothetical protein